MKGRYCRIVKDIGEIGNYEIEVFRKHGACESLAEAMSGLLKPVTWPLNISPDGISWERNGYFGKLNEVYENLLKGRTRKAGKGIRKAIRMKRERMIPVDEEEVLLNNIEKAGEVVKKSVGEIDDMRKRYFIGTTDYFLSKNGKGSRKRGCG